MKWYAVSMDFMIFGEVHHHDDFIKANTLQEAEIKAKDNWQGAMNLQVNDITEIIQAWIQVEEVNADLEMLNDEDLIDVRDDIELRIKLIMDYLSEFVPDNIGMEGGFNI